MALIPKAGRVFWIWLPALSLAGCSLGKSPDELTAFDVRSQRMEVAPVESQAGPPPTVVPGVAEQADPPDLDPELISQEFERRRRVLDGEQTALIVMGRVSTTKAFLFENPEAEWA